MRARWIPIILLTGLVMVVFIQQQDTLVPLVWWGSLFPQVSLGLVLLVAYAVGLIGGILWELVWHLRDSLRQRKIQRQLDKLTDRLAMVEGDFPRLTPVSWTESDHSR
ncbi:MAG: hypothetical protein OHK0012_20380 [Synechococcales cyanobacterium]